MCFKSWKNYQIRDEHHRGTHRKIAQYALVEEQNVSIETITSMTDEDIGDIDRDIEEGKLADSDDNPKTLLKQPEDENSKDKQYRLKIRTLMLRRHIKHGNNEQKQRRKGIFVDKVHDIDWLVKRHHN